MKAIALRFSPDDLALVDALRTKTGIGNRTDVVRLAMRRFAASIGFEWPPPVASEAQPLARMGTEKKR